MSAIDNGGFDLVVNVTAATASKSAASSMAALSTAFSVSSSPWLRGSGSIKAAVAMVGFAPSNVITLTMSLAGSKIVATEVNPGTGWTPVSTKFGEIEIDGTVTVTDLVEAVGMSVVTNFQPDGTGHPGLMVSLDEPRFLASPVVQAMLSSVYYFAGGGAAGEAAYWVAREDLLKSTRTTITDEVLAQLSTLAPIVLTGAPVLPGHCPPPFSALAVSTTSTSLRLLLTISGSAGDPLLITKDWLLLQPATGLPLDAAYLVISNQSLLRDLVRCALITGSFPAAGFLPSEPCFFVGTATIGSMTISTLIVGIDEAGLLRVTFHFSVSGPSGAFTVTGWFSQGFALVKSPPGSAPTITLMPSGAPTVTSDVSLAIWVHFLGGNAVSMVLGAADLIVMGFTSGSVSGAIPLPTIPVPLSLAAGAPPVGIRDITTLQAEAPQRSITVGSISVPNPFRDHDVIVNLI